MKTKNNFFTKSEIESIFYKIDEVLAEYGFTRSNFLSQYSLNTPFGVLNVNIDEETDNVKHSLYKFHTSMNYTNDTIEKYCKDNKIDYKQNRYLSKSDNKISETEIANFINNEVKPIINNWLLRNPFDFIRFHSIVNKAKFKVISHEIENDEIYLISNIVELLNGSHCIELKPTANDLFVEYKMNSSEFLNNVLSGEFELVQVHNFKKY